MLFNSYIFLFLFLPCAASVFFILCRTEKPQIPLRWLLLSSLIFYVWSNTFNLILVLTSSFFNYGLSICINDLDIFWKNNKKLYKKILLFFGISINTSLIFYYKYIDFLIQNINSLFNTELPFQSHELPLGISFFTFLQIAYLVDTYRDQETEKNWFNYTLFVTFFPHLIAGPIVHHRALLRQFRDPEIYQFQEDNFAIGITIFILGLSKKILLADNLSLYSNSVFKAVTVGQYLGFLDAWGGILAYTLQLYFDFSGYSDMAIGLSKIFNIWLPENFNSPYKSANIIEFWRRWHITLSNFLRDYLYIPLGGNRKGTKHRYVNLMITMLLGGLWHGAGWTFIIWGGLHGCYLILNHLWRSMSHSYLQIRLLVSTQIWYVFSRALTFFAIVVGWVFFRSKTLNDSLTVLKSMFGFQNICWSKYILPQSKWICSMPESKDFMKYIVPIEGWFWIISLLLVVWFAPNTQKLTAPFYDSKNCEGLLSKQKFSFSIFWAIGISAMLVMCIARLSSASDFLYFAF